MDNDTMHEKIMQSKGKFKEKCTISSPRTCELLTTIGLIAKVANEANVDSTDIISLLDEDIIDEQKVYNCGCSVIGKMSGTNKEYGEIIMDIAFPGKPCRVG